MKKRLFFFVALLFLISVVAYRYAYTQREEFIIQTDTLAELAPHEHDAGEAVEDKGHHHYLVQTFIAPRDLWISEMAFGIFNAPDTTVHHAAVLIPNREHQTCKNIPFLQLAGFPQDIMHDPVIPFPEGTGMRVRKGETIRLVVMVHNPLPPVGPGGVYRDVYGQLRISAYPSFVRGLKEVKFHLIHLDSDPCNAKYSDGTEAFIFSVPPNSTDYTFRGGDSEDDPSVFVFKKRSKIVYLGGHLHGWQGGKRLFVEKNNTPFLSMITKLSNTQLYRYDSEYLRVDVPMEAGDVLRISAQYDNPNDVATRGAMGMLEMYYYEE